MPTPVPLIFSCDTEDYETPASDDAELLWARMFARHGIRACFCVVGEEARALHARGRRDVLAALAQHEVASHSNRHSAHPTPAEYLDTLSFGAGAARFMEEERPAVEDLASLLGQAPSAWCKPGNSWGPAIPSAAARLGIPLFCDAPLEWAPGEPMWFAPGPLLPSSVASAPAAEDAANGSRMFAGGVLLKYHTSFDRYFGVSSAERPARMRADFEALLANRREGAQRSGGMPGCIVMYTHPCRTVTAAFPDNFTAGRNPPREAWRPAPLRPQAEVDALVRDFETFLGWIAELRRAGQVEITGYREVYARVRRPVEWSLPVHQVSELARAAAVDDAPLEPRRVAGQWLSPAEQLWLLARTLAHAAAFTALPREVAVRTVLGPIEPEALPASPASRRRGAVVSLQAVQQAAGAAADHAARTGALPSSVVVAGLPEAIGPGQLLRLVARALTVWHGGSRNDTTLSVPAGGEETAFAQRDDFRALRFERTWSIFPPDFTGERLLRQAWWQTWTAKPAEA